MKLKRKIGIMALSLSIIIALIGSVYYMTLTQRTAFFDEDYNLYDTFDTLSQTQVKLLSSPSGIKLEDENWIYETGFFKYDDRFNMGGDNLRIISGSLETKRNLKGKYFKAYFNTQIERRTKIPSGGSAGEAIIYLNGIEIFKETTFEISRLTHTYRDYNLEIIPSLIDFNKIYVKLNGKQIKELNIEANRIYLKFAHKRGSGDEGALELLETKYKLPFNCEVPEGNNIILEHIEGGTTFGVFDQEFGIRKFCYNLPPIQIDQSSGGVQQNKEILDLLSQGRAVTIPNDQQVLLFYIGSSEEGKVCNKDEFLDEEKEECKKLNDLVGSCIQGVTSYDAVLGKCVGAEESINVYDVIAILEEEILTEQNTITEEKAEEILNKELTTEEEIEEAEEILDKIIIPQKEFAELLLEEEEKLIEVIVIDKNNEVKAELSNEKIEEELEIAQVVEDAKTKEISKRQIEGMIILIVIVVGLSGIGVGFLLGDKKRKK